MLMAGICFSLTHVLFLLLPRARLLLPAPASPTRASRVTVNVTQNVVAERRSVRDVVHKFQHFSRQMVTNVQSG